MSLLLNAAKCALADLEGIMPEFEPDGDRTHPAWITIKELRAAIKAETPTIPPPSKAEKIVIEMIAKALAASKAQGRDAYICPQVALPDCGGKLVRTGHLIKLAGGVPTDRLNYYRLADAIA